jgi:hypothetical protein
LQGVNKKETILFNKVIPANTQGKISERIKMEGTVERVEVRFYRGQQKALQIIPVVLHKGQKSEPLITFPEGTDGYLAGDDDNFKFDIVIPIENDDEVVIYYKNTDLTYDYTLMVHVSIDYYGGKNRVVGGVI